MAVEGTIQNGPLMEHTSYSGGDKVARVTANHAPRWMVGITGRYPETLVLYRMRPISLAQVGSGCRAGRVRYSCLKEAARGEAVMQIQWCRLDEKGIGEKSWSEQEGRQDWFGGG